MSNDDANYSIFFCLHVSLCDYMSLVTSSRFPAKIANCNWWPSVKPLQLAMTHRLVYLWEYIQLCSISSQSWHSNFIQNIIINK